MWKVVILMGMLNPAQGIPAGHSEMADVPGIEFSSKARCEEARDVVATAFMDDIQTRLGAENVMYSSVCWTHPGQSL